MDTPNAELVIAQTKKWIVDVVVGCNFCPFAAREVKRNSIHYEVLQHSTRESVLKEVVKSFQLLDRDENIETSLLILPGSFTSFDDYLQLVGLAGRLLKKEGYEGVYQVASFHPGYLFAGSSEADPANYTNRSPYPMLHFLREESVSKVVDNFPGVDDIPNRNIAFTRAKGLAYMKQLL